MNLSRLEKDETSSIIESNRIPLLFALYNLLPS